MNFKYLTSLKSIISGIKFISLFSLICIFLANCSVPNAMKPKKVSKDRPMGAQERARQNIEQGRGISLKDMTGKKSTTYEFSTSNPLWRASLETIDFMPLATVDYSGGIIITDWYSDNDKSNESVKISVRFLSNEVRSDALMVKVFYKSCSVQQSCKISDRSGVLSDDLTNKILSKAALKEISDLES